MNGPLRHTVAPTPRNGVKGQLEDLLRTRSESPDKATAETGLTLGEILRAMNLDKTRNGDVSAALHKLRTEGKVRFDTGPRSSATGPRFVKRYAWRLKLVKPAATPAQEDQGRRILSFYR